MKILKTLTSSVIFCCLLFSSGCFVTKAGNYVVDKSKSAYSASKTALGFDKEENKKAKKKKK